MKVVAAPNAFKGSLSAFAAASAIAAGVRRALTEADVTELGVADGGDGTAEVLCRALGGSFREVPTLDALGRAVSSRYVWLADATAVLDVATASGLARLEPSARSPLTATSYGTGQLLRAALEAGAKRIVLGVGGSASVDAGAGLLQALGARLLDGQGRELGQGGAVLAQLSRVDLSGLEPRARQVPIDVACDVDCLLLGASGAARLFGPQKGATPAMVEQLEAALTQVATVFERDFGRDVTRVHYAGAAGGLAAGVYAALGARLLPGIDLVLDLLGFEQALSGAQLCITGEGCLDRQSLHNKGPLGVARRASACGVPVVAIAGEIPDGLSARDFPQFSATFSLRGGSVTRERALRDAQPLLEKAAEQAARTLTSARPL